MVYCKLSELSKVNTPNLIHGYAFFVTAKKYYEKTHLVRNTFAFGSLLLRSLVTSECDFSLRMIYEEGRNNFLFGTI